MSTTFASKIGLFAAFLFALLVCVSSAGLSYQLTNVESLFAWVRSLGGTVDGITIMTPENGPRGLWTTKPHKNNSVMLVVPAEAMIHRGGVLNATRNPAFNAFYEPLVGSFPGDDGMLNAMYLMFENFYNLQDSAIAPYLNTLPTLAYDRDYFTFLPRFWHSKLQALIGTCPSGKVDFHDQLRNQMTLKHYITNTLYPYMSEKYIILSVDHLIDQFNWGLSIVSTRAWGDLSISSDPPKIKGGCTIVPIADMLNHRNFASALAAVTDDTTLIGHGVPAYKDFAAGEEIFDNYSPFERKEVCNINLMITFGFIDPHPGYDCFKVRMSVDWKKHEFVDMKKQLLESSKFDISQGSVSFTLQGSTLEIAKEHMDPQFMLFMRILAINSTLEIDRAQLAASGTIPQNEGWTLENEHKAINDAFRVFRKIEAEFETTIEEDLELEKRIDTMLKNSSLMLTQAHMDNLRREKMVIELRRREHMVIESAAKVVEQSWTNMLTLPLSEIFLPK